MGGIIQWHREAKVYEFTPKERMSFNWLCRRYFRLGTSDVLFWRLNHSLFYTLFWGLRRLTWNFLKNIFCLLVIGKPQKYYVKHLVLLVKTFGLVSGLLGYSFCEYGERHR